jgi:hypothetical protein
LAAEAVPVVVVSVPLAPVICTWMMLEAVVKFTAEAVSGA